MYMHTHTPFYDTYTFLWIHMHAYTLLCAFFPEATCTYRYVYSYTSVCTRKHTCLHLHTPLRYVFIRTPLKTKICMGWLRLVGSLKLQASFAEYCLFYRALLQKRPIILRSLLIIDTPYQRSLCACTPKKRTMKCAKKELRTFFALKPRVCADANTLECSLFFLLLSYVSLSLTLTFLRLSRLLSSFPHCLNVARMHTLFSLYLSLAVSPSLSLPLFHMKANSSHTHTHTHT